MRQVRTRLSVLAFGAAMMSACHSAPSQETVAGAAQQSEPPASSAPQSTAPAEDPVVTRARQALRDAGVDAAEYQLAAREAAQWNDSSLGCPKPGLSYMQVITHGEVLRFTGPRGAYEVHVSANNAVLCAPRVVGTPKRAGAPARNLDKVVEDAREDLHAKLGVDTKEVRVIGMTEAEWPDSSLGCPGVAPTGVGEPVTGYKLLLSARGQQFIYHTDLQRTFACPPIEQQ